MSWSTPRDWMKLSLLALLFVAAIGLIMRYKIGFSFPFFNQKYLQHAHSHLAFTGWVSQTLWVWILYNVGGEKLLGSQKIKTLLFTHYITALGMLFSFAYEGYGKISIFFSTSSLLISFLLIQIIYKKIKTAKINASNKWYAASFIFFLTSMVGTIYLIYMMIQKNIPQNAYLASVYGYLHFQYNGWFFFACMGVWIQNIEKKGFLKSRNKLNLSWHLLFWSCIPAYGLSTLWMKLPLYVYLLVVAAAFLQFIGWFIFLRQIDLKKYLTLKSNFQKTILFSLLITIFTKFILQLISVVPIMSQFAFGIRPIVIAYLHLVLLGIITLFILFQSQDEKWLNNSKVTKSGIWIFLSGFILNELLLVTQGITSLFYIIIPFIDIGLVVAALFLFTGTVFIFSSQFSKKIYTN